MPLPLLNGIVDTRDQELFTLRRQLAQLDEALRLERIKTGQVESGVRELRHVLNPLFAALRKIYGEMDDMGLSNSPVVNGDDRWNAIKARLAPRLQAAIDIFLTQGTMTSSALAAALRTSNSNCSTNVVGPLLRQGLLVRNGRELSLKAL